MATRTINWCSSEKLECGSSFPADAFLCVPASIVTPSVDTEFGFVAATVNSVRASTCTDPCGLCHWVYSISYDDAQLVTGSALTAQSINCVLCESCIVDFIRDQSSCANVRSCISVEDTESVDMDYDPDTGVISSDVVLSPLPGNAIQELPSGLYVTPAAVSCDDVEACFGIKYCWYLAETEADLINYNALAVGGIAVGDTITLTADIDLDIPLTVQPCGMIITDGFDIEISDFYAQGMYQMFSDETGVTFLEDAVEAVYPEWFGALGDDSNNDCDPMRTAIKAYRHIKLLNNRTYLIEETPDSGQFMLYLGVANGNTDRSGMMIEGAGKRSVIKLGDDVGPEYLLFGSGNGDALYDMTFRNFAIDLNGANNLQLNFGDPLRLNSAFYFSSYCENIWWDGVHIYEGSGSQWIRVGNDLLAGVGKNITFTNCDFYNFGIAIPGNNLQDVSVLYVEADNIRVDNCNFSCEDFAFDLSRGHTAIEMHGKNGAKITGCVFDTLQLPALWASTLTDAYNLFITDNTFINTNYFTSIDPSANGNNQSRILWSENTFTSTKSNSILIPIGISAEGARERTQLAFHDNVVDFTGNANQGTHLFRIENSYLNNLSFQDNDIGPMLGTAVYMAGPALPDGVGEIKISGNRMDSVGATGGVFPADPCFAVIAPSSGTLASLIIEDNDLHNTQAKDYSALGLFRRSGNIDYVSIEDNDNHTGYTTLLTGTLGTNTYRSQHVVRPNWNETVYESGNVAVGAATDVNIASFAAFVLGDIASLTISGSFNNGAIDGVAVWEVLWSSTGTDVFLISEAGTFGPSITFSFSGANLRIGNTSGGAVTAIFRVTNFQSTKPINWLF